MVKLIPIHILDLSLNLGFLLSLRLYIIKDYQRLKKDKANRLTIGWCDKRGLSKINYRIHTDAVKKFLITLTLSPKKIAYIYA